jgi:hypothetical protein
MASRTDARKASPLDPGQALDKYCNQSFPLDHCFQQLVIAAQKIHGHQSLSLLREASSLI